MKEKKHLRKIVKDLAIVAVLLFIFVPSRHANAAATETARKEFREEVITMYKSADSDIHDIYRYKFTYSEMNSIIRSVENNECYLESQCGYSIYPSVTQDSNGIVKTLKLENFDSDFFNRLERMKATIEDALSTLDKNMTEMEKALALHDYIVTHTIYKYNANSIEMYSGGCVLGNGHGVCSGYDAAYRILLKYAGIEAEYLSGASMNHQWTAVKIDGEWYHTDTTWDDSYSNTGSVSHKFFMLNDQEITHHSIKNHGAWFNAYTTIKSTSTKYTDWFVHDVDSAMVYYDGYWYFFKSNDLYRAKISGAEMQKIISLNTTAKKILLKKVTDSSITYALDGVEKTLSLDTPENIPSDIIIEDMNPNTDRTNTSSDSETTLSDISSANLSDLNNWRIGEYVYNTGLYAQTPYRLCLKDYVTVNTNTSYSININKPSYCTHIQFTLLIRELDKDGKLIASKCLVNGATYTPKAGTAKIGVTLSNSKSNNYTIDEYSTLFNDGLKVQIADNNAVSTPSVEEKPEDSETPDQEPESGSDTAKSGILSTDFSDLNSWRIGEYLYDTGLYAETANRLCLKDYITVDDAMSYLISITKPRSCTHVQFTVLIRELDKDGNKIGSKCLNSGAVYTPKAGTAKIGLTIMNSQGNSYTLSDYQTLFNNGLCLKITENQ